MTEPVGDELDPQTMPDAWEELTTCLEVLTDHADRLVARRASQIDEYDRSQGRFTSNPYVPESMRTEGDELITALYQTADTVRALGQENDQAWDAIYELRALVNTLQEKGNLAPKPLSLPPQGIVLPGS